MKKLISCFFVTLFTVQGFMFIKQPKDNFLPYENRMLKEFPAHFRLTTNGIRKFFSGVDGYFNDRIMGRNHILYLYGRINTLNEGNINTVLVGTDGWLFLGNDHDQTLDKLVNKASPKTRKKSEDYTKSIIDQTQAKASATIILMGPNKSSIYPEYLPAYIQPAKERYAATYLKKLSDAGLSVIDPTEALIEAKTRGHLMYFRSDTHWNELGASEAFNFLMKTVNTLNGFKTYNAPGYSFIPDELFHGDLIALSNLLSFEVRPGDNYRSMWAKQYLNIVQTDAQGRQSPLINNESTGLVKPGQSFIVLNPDAVLDKTVWFYHDSFGKALSPFFHATFKETRHFAKDDFFKPTPPDFDSPDLIVFEFVERQL